MADIQQWMRKTIQPVRTRTPTFPLTSDERRSTVDASSLSESSTPRRRSGPRKKISSYFSYRSSKYSDGAAADDVWPCATSTHRVSMPDINTMVDAIFIKLCNQPFDGLPAQMNSSMLHVIEAYRNLAGEREQLDEQMEELANRLEDVEKNWKKDETTYRAEIKRLELIIARGKDGMSKLMASRQDSVLNRRNNSRIQVGPHPSTTMTQAATLMKRKENAQDNQQATSISPSSKERALSIQLLSAISQDIPVGTPPQGEVSNTLGRVSAFPGGLKESLFSQGHSPHPKGESGLANTKAASSTSGDNVPHVLEVPETLPRSDVARDFQAIKRMASAIATNRGLKVEQILPRLIELFDNAEAQLKVPAHVEAVQRTPTGPQIRRPPSWIPGDDGSGRRDSPSTIPTIRPPLRTADSFASSRREILSDLSASSSDESEAEFAVKRPSKIPSPTHDKGLARSRQEQRASVVTVVAGPEMLSSSASSRKTAFRNSSDSIAMVRQISSRSLSASAAHGGAMSCPDAPAASSTTGAPQRSSPPQVTGRTSGQLPLKERTNEVDNAAKTMGARAARSAETTVSAVKDGAHQAANQKRFIK